MRSHLPPVEPALRFKPLRASCKLTVIRFSATIDFLGDVHKPLLGTIGLSLVASVTLMVGQIKSETIVFGNAIGFVADVVVPTNKIDSILKVVTVCTVITG